MAYSCPVCEQPQIDATHLANHLAFTAVIREDDHEVWLDEHAPGWGEDDEETLSGRLRELDVIESIEHLIDDIEAETHGHDHDHGQPVQGRTGALDEEAEEILSEARELTRRIEKSEGETE